MRELQDQIGLDGREILEPTAINVQDHRGWEYTTFFAEPNVPLDITQLKLQKSEITALAWATREELDSGKYMLHPGFKATTRVFNYYLPFDLDPETGRIPEEYSDDWGKE
ncbi:hypothetical protein F5Y05DRAFT_368017, partial [Hypoxylon sp. FL0543]